MNDEDRHDHHPIRKNPPKSSGPRGNQASQVSYLFLKLQISEIQKNTKLVKTNNSTYVSATFLGNKAKRKKKTTDTDGQFVPKRHKNGKDAKEDDEVHVVERQDSRKKEWGVQKGGDGPNNPEIESNQADNVVNNHHGTAASDEVLENPTEGYEAHGPDGDGPFSPLVLSPAKEESKTDSKEKEKSVPAPKKKGGRKKKK